MNQAHSSSLLRNKLAGVRDKMRNLALGTGFSWMVLALIILLGVGMFIDWRLNLDAGVRTLLLMIYAVVLFSILRKEILNPLGSQPDDDDVALAVERSKEFTDYRSRLIAATQFGREELPKGIAGTLVADTISQAEEISKSRDFNSIIPTDGFWRAFFIAVLVAGAGGMIYKNNPGDIGDLLKRAFLTSGVEVPRNTHMDAIMTFHVRDNSQADANSSTIDIVQTNLVPRLETVRIVATVKKESEINAPKTAIIAVKYASADRAIPTVCTNIASKGEPGRYELELSAVREPFTISAKAGDAFEIEGEMTVESRPSIEDIKFVQEFPAYTGSKPQERRRGDLAILQNSKLKVEVKPNKPIKTAQVVLFKEGNEVFADVKRPAKVDVVSDDKVNVTIPLEDLAITGFEVRFTDKNGITSKDEPRYRVAMLPDKTPILRILQPIRGEEKVTDRARIPLVVQLRDDFGVDNLMLMVSMSDGSGEEPPPMPPKMLKLEQASNPRLYRVEYDLDIGKIQPPKADGTFARPTIGTTIRYWFMAKDQKPSDGANDNRFGQSRVMVAQVVSDEEKRRDLQNRASDSIAGVNETAGNQEKLNEELGEIIRVLPESN